VQRITFKVNDITRQEIFLGGGGCGNSEDKQVSNAFEKEFHSGQEVFSER
jgi:hypothetical protein